MIKKIILPILCTGILLLSCGDNNDSATTQKDKLNLSGVELANEKDPVCEMPISTSSAKDTLHTSEGVYGFCCEGCKSEYKNQLAHENL